MNKKELDELERLVALREKYSRINDDFSAVVAIVLLGLFSVFLFRYVHETLGLALGFLTGLVFVVVFVGFLIPDEDYKAMKEIQDRIRQILFGRKQIGFDNS